MAAITNTVLAAIRADIEEVELKHVRTTVTITSSKETRELECCEQCSGFTHEEPWPCAAARTAQWLRRMVLPLKRV